MFLHGQAPLVAAFRVRFLSVQEEDPFDPVSELGDNAKSSSAFTSLIDKGLVKVLFIRYILYRQK
jgi:hypothetical protein